VKRWLTPVLLGLIPVIALSWHYFERRHEYRAEREAAARAETRDVLMSVVIPHLVLENASFEEALAYLRRQAAAAGLPASLSIRVMSEAELKRVFRRRKQPETPLVSDLEHLAKPEVSLVPPGQGPITLTLTQLPVIEAARYVAALTERRMRISPQGIEITPPLLEEGSIEPLVKREWPVRPGFLTRIVPNETPADPASSTLDALSFLRSVGMRFDEEGTRADYDSQRGILVMVNTEDNIDLFESTVTGCGPTSPPSWLMLQWERLRSVFFPRSAAPPPAIPVYSTPPYQGPEIPGLESAPADDAAPQG